MVFASLEENERLRAWLPPFTTARLPETDGVTLTVSCVPDVPADSPIQRQPLRPISAYAPKAAQNRALCLDVILFRRGECSGIACFSFALRCDSWN
jgi:hypothetical protein